MDRKQLESAAAGNHYLRGLLAIPIGIVLIASALGNMQWGPFRHFWVAIAAFLLAAALYLATVRHYNDHYGRVLPKMGLRGALAIGAAIVVMGGGPALVQAADLPLNGIALAWAAVALTYYARSVGLQPHHMVIWGAVLVIGLVPLWGDPRTTDVMNVGMLVVGVAVMATGVLDHRLLVRTFGPSHYPRLESSNAGD